MNHKILLIGSIGAGKTTLKQRLLSESMVYRKTQVLEFGSLFIDCPGEYLEIPQYYHVLIDTSRQVSEIWALQDASRRRCFYPPKFAKAFRRPVIGIVTKIDREDASAEMAEKFLQQAGFGDAIYRVSAQSGDGVNILTQRLAALTNGS